MAGKVRTLYLLYGEGFFFSPWQSGRAISDLLLTLQDYYEIRIQVVSSPDFIPNSDGTAPANVSVDVSQYGNGNLALYSIPSWQNGWTSSVIAAWSGFDPSDLPWYAPASGRVSYIVTPTSAIPAAVYLAQFSFVNGSNYLRCPDIPMLMDLRLQLATGTEPSPPTVISGTAVIPAGQSQVTVNYSTLQANGIVYPFWLETPQSTLGATVSVGSFTIIAGGPMPQSANVGWFIASLS